MNKYCKRGVKVERIMHIRLDSSLTCDKFRALSLKHASFVFKIKFPSKDAMDLWDYRRDTMGRCDSCFHNRELRSLGLP